MKTETGKVKKINVGYLLAYIFVPIAVIVLCGLISFIFFPKGAMAAILFMGPWLFSVLWWVLGGKTLYNKQKKKLEKELDASGFIRNHTFNANTCQVIVDVNHGKIALLFFWNPFKSYVLPASRISRVWVDDGRGGKGFMEGSSQVSFLMMVDGVKIRVYTFTSNRRWRMDSNYILTGISKADMMVKALETARSRAD